MSKKDAHIAKLYRKIEGYYAYARILRSEIDMLKGRFAAHSSATSLIRELEDYDYPSLRGTKQSRKN